MAKKLEKQLLDEHYAILREKSEREDLVMFINSCFAATRQNEYYTNRFEQSVSIDFLHRYVMVNYRRVYARALAAGINHFNQAQIIFNLLRSGAPSDVEQRNEEGELIGTAICRLPANRAFRLLKSLQLHRINNRRSRAVIKRFLDFRKDAEFDAVKYRNKFRSIAGHAHIPLSSEIGKFLFNFKSAKRFETPLFDKFRQAWYSQEAIYDLPFTVAESLATHHDIPRDVFLRKIQPKMTAAEKLRFQSASARTGGAPVEFDLKRAPLTRLAIYILSLTAEERMERHDELHQAMVESATRTVCRSPFSLGKVAAVLDRSRSSAGSREKRNRPLAISLAISYLLRSASDNYRAFWTPDIASDSSELSITPTGQTSLAEPFIDALEWKPDLIVIVSDGYENDPPATVNQIAEVCLEKRELFQPPEIVHVNPVFDSDHFSPKSLGPAIATVGLRDADDLATMLGFARYAFGNAPLKELEAYLESRAQAMLGGKSDGQ